jgi:hypothetical protein
MRAASLVMSHRAIALLFPALSLSMAEAMTMAEAQLNAQAQFEVVVSPRMEALIALATTHSAIYAPKLGLMWEQAGQRAKARQQAAGMRGFGGAKPAPPGQESPVPPAGRTDNVTHLIFPTGQPDAGTIDFGPT